MVEQGGAAVSEAKTGKAARDPEVVAFDEGVNVPVVDDATLRGKLGKRGDIVCLRGRIHTHLV